MYQECHTINSSILLTSKKDLNHHVSPSHRVSRSVASDIVVVSGTRRWRQKQIPIPIHEFRFATVLYHKVSTFESTEYLEITILHKVNIETLNLNVIPFFRVFVILAGYEYVANANVCNKGLFNILECYRKSHGSFCTMLCRGERQKVRLNSRWRRSQPSA